MSDTATPFDPTGFDFSEFEEGSAEWNACRERDVRETEALEEMFEAQRKGGEFYLAWLEKTKGKEARDEVERRGDEAQEKREAERKQQLRSDFDVLAEDEAVPVPAPTPVSADSIEPGADAAAQPGLDSLLLSKTLDELGANEDSTAESMSISPILSSVICLEGGGKSPTIESNEDGEAVAPLQSREGEPGDTFAEEKATTQLESIEEIFPSLPSATAEKPPILSTHPKSLYGAPSKMPKTSIRKQDVQLATPTAGGEENPTKVQHDLSRPSSHAYKTADGQSGNRPLVLKKSAVPGYPVQIAIAEQHDRPDAATDPVEEITKAGGEKPIPARVQQAAPRATISKSAAKKQKKHELKTFEAAPEVVADPIVGRKRKEKKLTYPKL